MIWLAQSTDNWKWFAWSPRLWGNESGLYIVFHWARNKLMKDNRGRSCGYNVQHFSSLCLVSATAGHCIHKSYHACHSDQEPVLYTMKNNIINDFCGKAHLHTATSKSKIQRKHYKRHFDSNANFFTLFWSPRSLRPMESLFNEIKYGQQHVKTNKMSKRPAKIQISLGICPVWPESSLSAWRKLGSLATLPHDFMQTIAGYVSFCRADIVLHTV